VLDHAMPESVKVVHRENIRLWDFVVRDQMTCAVGRNVVERDIIVVGFFVVLMARIGISRAANVALVDLFVESLAWIQGY